MGGHTRATRSSLSLPYVDGIAGAVVMVPRSTLRLDQSCSGWIGDGWSASAQLYDDGPSCLMLCFIWFCNGMSIVRRAGGAAEEGRISARSTGVCAWLASTLHADATVVVSMHGGNVARASAMRGERGIVFSAPDAIC